MAVVLSFVLSMVANVLEKMFPDNPPSVDVVVDPTQAPTTPVVTPPVTPPSPPVDPPSTQMQSRFAGLKEMMAKADASKAATWKSIWDDWAAAIATPPATKSEFRSATKMFCNAASEKAGLAKDFPDFPVELDKCFVATFGEEDGALDGAKAIEFTKAIVWACTR